ncbi:MAG: glucuronate isomerase [Gillisia sp.]
MNNFLNDNFLLDTKYARFFYETYAQKLPIIDYHNHLPPQEIAEDRQYENITQLWLNGDHYKWRAMRTLGIDEKYITGDASDKEKFLAWAKTVPYTLRNPLYHWTHLELRRYFGIEELLNEESAERIYKEVNKKLQQPEFSCRGLLSKMKVDTLCTTEDPTDMLESHKKLKQSSFEIQVSTAFRPDKAILIEKDSYNSYLEQLEKTVNVSIDSYDSLKSALKSRIEYFHQNGCRLSDHGMAFLSYSIAPEEEINTIFNKRRKGEKITSLEAEKYKTSIMLYLCELYSEKEWVQQFHLGALRNNNHRKLNELGPDTGWDSIGDYPQAENLSNFLDALDQEGKLTKTILYNLNPSDNEVFASMIGNFNDGSVKGKMQYGSGWWYMDQLDGMKRQMNALSNIGLLSCFVGMLTDSRSFLSFPRHEYFRRLLCQMIGRDIENGHLPDDKDLIGKMIEDICYFNAKNYFGF